MDILIVDDKPKRLENLKKALFTLASNLESLECCAEITKHYDVIIAHRNNYDDFFKGQFEKSALNYDSPIIWFTGGAVNGLFRIWDGDEYKAELWKKGIEHFFKDKSLDSFVSVMYMAEVIDLLNVVSPLSVLPNNSSANDLRGIARIVESVLLRRKSDVRTSTVDALSPGFYQRVESQISKLAIEPDEKRCATLRDNLREDLVGFCRGWL